MRTQAQVLCAQRGGRRAGDPHATVGAGCTRPVHKSQQCGGTEGRSKKSKSRGQRRLRGRGSVVAVVSSSAPGTARLCSQESPPHHSSRDAKPSQQRDKRTHDSV